MLFKLFYTFAKIGLFTFGGGYGMIAIVQDEYTSSQPVQLPAPHSVVDVSLLRKVRYVKQFIFKKIVNSFSFYVIINFGL